MNRQKRIRGLNFSHEENIKLLEEASKFKSIIENKIVNKQTTDQKEAAWLQIYNAFNLKNNSIQRSLEQLKSKYKNLKWLAYKHFGTGTSILDGNFIYKLKQRSVVSNQMFGDCYSTFANTSSTIKTELEQSEETPPSPPISINSSEPEIKEEYNDTANSFISQHNLTFSDESEHFSVPQTDSQTQTETSVYSCRSTPKRRLNSYFKRQFNILAYKRKYLKEKLKLEAELHKKRMELLQLEIEMKKSELELLRMGN